MSIGFAASIAGSFHAHQAGVLAILHIIDEFAVFDQHGAIGRGAFVINGQRTPALGNRAVIDDRDTLGGNLLSKQTGKGRGLFD